MLSILYCPYEYTPQMNIHSICQEAFQQKTYFLTPVFSGTMSVYPSVYMILHQLTSGIEYVEEICSAHPELIDPWEECCENPPATNSQ